MRGVGDWARRWGVGPAAGTGTGSAELQPGAWMMQRRHVVAATARLKSKCASKGREAGFGGKTFGLRWAPGAKQWSGPCSVQVDTRLFMPFVLDETGRESDAESRAAQTEGNINRDMQNK